MNREYFMNEYSGEVFNSADLEDILGNRTMILTLTEEGYLNKIGSGFYSVGNVSPSDEIYLVVSKYYPDAVISGYSALYEQGLGDYLPPAMSLDVLQSGPTRPNEIIDFRRVSGSKIIGVDTPQNAVKTILELITTSNIDTESTDDEILDDFNKIKSGEASRMAQKSLD